MLRILLYSYQGGFNSFNFIAIRRGKIAEKDRHPLLGERNIYYVPLYFSGEKIREGTISIEIILKNPC